MHSVVGVHSSLREITHGIEGGGPGGLGLFVSRERAVGICRLDGLPLAHQSPATGIAVTVNAPVTYSKRLALEDVGVISLFPMARLSAMHKFTVDHLLAVSSQDCDASPGNMLSETHSLISRLSNCQGDLPIHVVAYIYRETY